MTHPLLIAIDAALDDTLPDGICVIADGEVISAIRDELDQNDNLRAPVIYNGVTINRSLAQIDGDWMVRIVPGYDVHPRDPETGKFVERGDAE